MNAMLLLGMGKIKMGFIFFEFLIYVIAYKIFLPNNSPCS